jgi:hypothetical protein
MGDSIPQRAALLWLSGLRLSDARSIPAVDELMTRGVTVEFEPKPITGSQAQFFQVMSGQSPASFGFFDTLTVRNYMVSEDDKGRGPMPKLLPDLLRTVGWIVSYVEAEASTLVSHFQEAASSLSDVPACVLIKCAFPQHTAEGEAAIVGALQAARAWAGDDGLVALLSDTQATSIERYVNLNNFLADMGIIERDEQSGQINWEASLAYCAGHGQLLVNLMGRDPQGAVHPQEEYEEVRDTLVKALPNKVRDPETGDAVIERIYRKEELYSGDYLFCAPDLVVVFHPGYAPSPRSTHIGFDDAVFTMPTSEETAQAGINPTQAGGFLVAAAPTLAERVTEYERAPLTAALPTLLHALGIEYVGMESSAISTLFTYEYLESHPIRSQGHSQELSAEDEELIISHLRDLGYV